MPVATAGFARAVLGIDVSIVNMATPDHLKATPDHLKLSILLAQLWRARVFIRTGVVSQVRKTKRAINGA